MKRGQLARVYVMRRDDGAHKVGHSVDPHGRTGAIARAISHGGRLEVVHVTEPSNAAEKIERLAHRLLELSGKRIEGNVTTGRELFSATLDECIAAIAQAERIVSGVDQAPDLPRSKKVEVSFRIDAQLRARLDRFCHDKPYPVSRSEIVEAALMRWLDEDDAKRQQAREKEER